MIRAYLIPVIVLVGGGVIAGLMMNDGFSSTETAERADRWTEPDIPTDYSQSRERFLHSLFESKLLPAPLTSQLVVPVNAPDTDVTVSRPPFPLVLSAARIDGEFKIQVRMAGGEIINAGVGHSLPGDWLITQLSLDSITASQAGEAFTIDLTHPEAPS